MLNRTQPAITFSNPALAGRTGVTEQEIVVQRNMIERERLQALCYHLRHEDMECGLSPDWTVATTLAHIAFWDRQVLAMIEEWERIAMRPAELSAWIARTGRDWLPNGCYTLWENVGVTREDALRMSVDDLNEAALIAWKSMTNEEIVRDVLAATELLDWKIRTLKPGTADEILSSDRFWTLDPSGHRAAHAYRIETALARYV